MTSIKDSMAWKVLQNHHDAVVGLSMRELFSGDGNRFENFSLILDDMLLDYSKNRITGETMRLLLDLARERGLEARRDEMFCGKKINNTENRAVLHTALRNRSSRKIIVDGQDVMEEIRDVLARMRRFSDKVRDGSWRGATGKAVTDVVNIGIGGSYLGPMMVCEALKPYQRSDLRPHFVSNVDGSEITETLKGLDPETTLFLVASKTFSTLETRVNAETARAWLTGKLGEKAVPKHFAALSANAEAAAEFGIDRENVFEFWDWVGGRFSLWSAVGLVIAIALGMDRFEDLLEGASEMDAHFRTAPLEENMPVVMAMLGIWYINFFDAEDHAVLPYDRYLSHLPAYLEQAEMESNGKSVTRNGEPVDYITAPVVFGEAGTNGQHSFYQLIHQGRHLVPADFIAPALSHNPTGDHHRILLSNFFAQTEALMQGRPPEEVRAHLAGKGTDEDEIERLLPHQVFEGNRPTNSILVRRFDPRTLGRLIALYEHKVFVQGVVWDINSFDQWGVELGKQLAERILPQLGGSDPVSGHDGSTNGLINHFKKLRAG
ncbi:MAG TPA: glucose-6-phosphate isomerase [Rhodospirillales bacterium]|nr:glucose-6-phosphate isomerase [Rhodospirillales bacterium]